MKRYAFYGKGAYDLVYFLALLLCRLGERVQVFDGTNSRYLCRGVLKDCAEGNSGSFAGVDFFAVSRESVMDVIEQESDEKCCLLYMAEEPEDCLRGFQAFLVVGNLPEELEKIPEKLQSFGEEGFVILRDAIRSVVDAGILEMIYLPEWFARENLCEIPFDWVDYQTRIQLCYELPRVIPELSKGYSAVLADLAAWMTKKDARQIKKAYRKGRRGCR